MGSCKGNEGFRDMYELAQQSEDPEEGVHEPRRRPERQTEKTISRTMLRNLNVLDYFWGLCGAGTVL